MIPSNRIKARLVTPVLGEVVETRRFWGFSLAETGSPGFMERDLASENKEENDKEKHLKLTSGSTSWHVHTHVCTHTRMNMCVCTHTQASHEGVDLRLQTRQVKSSCNCSG